MHIFSPSLAFPFAILLTVGGLHGQAVADDDFKINLETHQAGLRAGQAFQLACQVSADKAQILEVFFDCAKADGPEHSWKHRGEGRFEAKVEHIEADAGAKEYEMWVKLQQGETTRYVGQTFEILISSADGDRELEEFLGWMKRTGYSDDIIKIYTHDGTKPMVRKEWDRYFAMRQAAMPYREMQTMPVLFLDILANDEEATNKPVEAQTDLLEAYLERIFGKDFNVQYESLKVSYLTRFGQPALQKNSKGQEWLKFNPMAFNTFALETTNRITQERGLPKNAVILRWAAKEWKHQGKLLKIEDHTGSGPAFSGHDLDNYGLAIYAHEWGHGLPAGHMFVNGPGSYLNRIWGLDCIMNHSYVPYANPQVGRLLSPLLRYALEPKSGFTDQDRFAAEYNESMAGTELLRNRLSETERPASVASTMIWTTPWQQGAGDSVVCDGLQNPNFILKGLHYLPDLEPGTYTLDVTTTGPNQTPEEVVIKQGGHIVSSSPIRWREKLPQTITVGKHLTFTLASNGKGSNLHAIHKLLNNRRLVVPAQ